MRSAAGISILGTLLILASFPGSLQAGPKGPAKVGYAKHVKPILAAKCVLCHGEAAALGGLRLDTPAGIKKGGLNGPAVVPGKSKQSHMIKRLLGQGPLMPPTEKLPGKDVNLVSQWVDQGAKFD